MFNIPAERRAGRFLELVVADRRCRSEPPQLVKMNILSYDIVEEDPHAGSLVTSSSLRLTISPAVTQPLPPRNRERGKSRVFPRGLYICSTVG